MGRLIVIDGLDGSGKTTQSQRLYEELVSQGKKVRIISFPDYDSQSSALVKMYLGGEFGSDPEAVNAYAASASSTWQSCSAWARSSWKMRSIW